MSATTLSQLTNAVPGRVGTTDADLAWHYGDPFAEQRRLAAGNGTVDYSNRGVIAVAGQDRLNYLHALTTQHLTGLKPGESALAFDLNPQGFVLHELHLIAGEELLWISCEPESITAFADYLRKMRFRSQVEISDVSDELAVLWQPVSEVHSDYPTWLSPHSWRAREILVPRTEAAAIVATDPVGTWAREALRVEAKVARQGFETDHHTLPPEVGWLETGVHMNKGCYRGQETISKIVRMGQPPRRLALLLLDGSSDELPQPGAEVRSGDSKVGFLGTAVQHYELGPIGLAVLKRTAAGVDLEVAGMHASELLAPGEDE